MLGYKYDYDFNDAHEKVKGGVFLTDEGVIRFLQRFTQEKKREITHALDGKKGEFTLDTNSVYLWIKKVEYSEPIDGKVLTLGEAVERSG